MNKRRRICLILEGSYPYVVGGVSSWTHQYIQGMPDTDFILWTIGASEEKKGQFRYQLPDNVVEVHEIFLGTKTERRHLVRKGKNSLTFSQMHALRAVLQAILFPDTAEGMPVRISDTYWNILFSMFQNEGYDTDIVLTGRPFMSCFDEICANSVPFSPFSELFHTTRSILLPLFYLLEGTIPEADIYHAISTGYAGILGALAKWKRGRRCAFVLTEHGIYTREREEEILRANWLDATARPCWKNFFTLIAMAAYDNAICITSLFRGARKLQIERGADGSRCLVIPNGIHTEIFCRIPQKSKNASKNCIKIGAAVRIAPIKDLRTMLQAFSLLRQRLDRHGFAGLAVQLYIMGPVDDPSYNKDCQLLLKQLGLQEVYFTGVVDVTQYLPDMDFTLLSSISEGQPLSVLESMAAGRPCVTTEVGACTELLDGIGDDTLGRAGFHVLPVDAKKMAEAMERLCLDRQERIRMGMVGRKRAVRYYQHTDMLKKYRKMYDTACGTTGNKKSQKKKQRNHSFAERTKTDRIYDRRKGHGRNRI